MHTSNQEYLKAEASYRRSLLEAEGRIKDRKVKARKSRSSLGAVLFRPITTIRLRRA